MKTIRQIADEIGVSKQAVHQKIKRQPLTASLQPFTSTVDGTVYISVDGEMLIKSAFSDLDCKHVDDNEPSTVDGDVYSVLKATIDAFQVQLTMLQNQLEIKDKQIDDLGQRLAEAQSMAQAEQALHAGTIQNALTDGKKKKWWQRN